MRVRARLRDESAPQNHSESKRQTSVRQARLRGESAPAGKLRRKRGMRCEGEVKGKRKAFRIKSEGAKAATGDYVAVALRASG